MVGVAVICNDLDLFLEGSGDHRDLHVLTHTFPTRRSSDLDFKGKYQGSYEEVSSAIDRHSARPQIDRARFFSALVFNLIIGNRSEEHTSELQSLMRISYAVFFLKKEPTTLSDQH